MRAVQRLREQHTLEKGGGDSSSESIVVAVRVRPLIAREVKAKETQCIETNGNTVTVGLEDANSGQSFESNHCFPPSASQVDVYRGCGITELVSGVVRGISGTLFAYGQTGSGKTFTVFGNKGEEIGLIYC